MEGFERAYFGSIRGVVVGENAVFVLFCGFGGVVDRVQKVGFGGVWKLRCQNTKGSVITAFCKCNIPMAAEGKLRRNVRDGLTRPLAGAPNFQVFFALRM